MLDNTTAVEGGTVDSQCDCTTDNTLFRENTLSPLFQMLFEGGDDDNHGDVVKPPMYPKKNKSSAVLAVSQQQLKMSAQWSCCEGDVL